MCFEGRKTIVLVNRAIKIPALKCFFWKPNRVMRSQLQSKTLLLRYSHRRSVTKFSCSQVLLRFLSHPKLCSNVYQSLCHLYVIRPTWNDVVNIVFPDFFWVYMWTSSEVATVFFLLYRLCIRRPMIFFICSFFFFNFLTASGWFSICLSSSKLQIKIFLVTIDNH